MYCRNDAQHLAKAKSNHIYHYFDRVIDAAVVAAAVVAAGAAALLAAGAAAAAAARLALQARETIE